MVHTNPDLQGMPPHAQTSKALQSLEGRAKQHVTRFVFL
jgi:hypothetical protein